MPGLESTLSLKGCPIDALSSSTETRERWLRNSFRGEDVGSRSGFGSIDVATPSCPKALQQSLSR